MHKVKNKIKLVINAVLAIVLSISLIFLVNLCYLQKALGIDYEYEYIYVDEDEYYEGLRSGIFNESDGVIFEDDFVSGGLTSCSTEWMFDNVTSDPASHVVSSCNIKPISGSTHNVDMSVSSDGNMYKENNGTYTYLDFVDAGVEQGSYLKIPRIDGMIAKKIHVVYDVADTSQETAPSIILSNGWPLSEDVTQWGWSGERTAKPLEIVKFQPYDEEEEDPQVDFYGTDVDYYISVCPRGNPPDGGYIQLFSIGVEYENIYKDISGAVLNSKNIGVPDANVHFKHKSDFSNNYDTEFDVTTDEDGWWHADAVLVGTWDYEINAKDYDPASGSIYVSKEQRVPYLLYLGTNSVRVSYEGWIGIDHWHFKIYDGIADVQEYDSDSFYEELQLNKSGSITVYGDARSVYTYGSNYKIEANAVFIEGFELGPVYVGEDLIAPDGWKTYNLSDVSENWLIISALPFGTSAFEVFSVSDGHNSFIVDKYVDDELVSSEVVKSINEALPASTLFWVDDDSVLHFADDENFETPSNYDNLYIDKHTSYCVTAIPNDHFNFKNWSISGDTLVPGKTYSCDIYGKYSLYATYAQIQPEPGEIIDYEYVDIIDASLAALSGDLLSIPLVVALIFSFIISLVLCFVFSDKFKSFVIANIIKLKR